MRWDDIEDKVLTPSVKIKVQQGDELEGTTNLFAATTLIVDFGIFTSKKKDLDGKEANGIRGAVRNLINQDDIVTTLNAIPGLLVYNRGIIPQSSADLSNDSVWQKMITILVVATTEETL